MALCPLAKVAGESGLSRAVKPDVVPFFSDFAPPRPTPAQKDRRRRPAQAARQLLSVGRVLCRTAASDALGGVSSSSSSSSSFNNKAQMLLFFLFLGGFLIGSSTRRIKPAEFQLRLIHVVRCAVCVCVCVLFLELLMA